MNALADMLTDKSHDIVYPNLATVELNENGKPTSSWMKDWTQEERTEKFFEFCRAYDQREDSLLRDNYQQFSHRLHWHECPFVDEVAKISDPKTVLHACLIFSFSNEHWLTYRTWRDQGEDAMRERFLTERHARSDLFQIYYPKGTDVKTWLIENTKKAAEDMHHIVATKNRPYSMMEFAKILNDYFVEEQGFRNAMYPCKNAARHVAMSHPEWVDPESFLHGGTGFFDGFSQVFACPHLMGKVKYKIDTLRDGDYEAVNKHGIFFLDKMLYLYNHKSNPIREQKWLNLEDKLCFFYKHIAITNGIKDTTKQIPYEWVYPKEWSLKTNRYDRLN